MPKKSTDSPESVPKKKKVKPDRPSARDLPRRLDELNTLHRPESVPEHAHFLCAFVNVPGDNTQRTQHWAEKKRWFDEVVQDFRLSSNLQDHPGAFPHPLVYAVSLVSRTGDDINRFGRLKKVIDTLQVPQFTVTGRSKNGGVLGLFKDDKVLKTDVSIWATEKYSKAQDRKVMFWVWDKGEI